LRSSIGAKAGVTGNCRPAETSPGFNPDRAEQAAYTDHAERVAAETCLVPEEPYVSWWKRDYESLGYA
jgi:hypothetical protein